MSPEPTAAWAVGMVMALTPCSARDAQRVLAAAAEKSHVAVVEVAAAMVAGSRGLPVPLHVERALRHAVEAARTPHHPRPGTATARVGLTPARARTEEALSRFRASQARLSGAPAEHDARRAMDDAAYTLCVLMGRPTVHEAALAAVALLSAPV
ncbi:DUF5133 domain-containing protein [Streptomyces sp. APSN-46.1]|uniref:DUF5133 domain-containing protein n=1 Tax=Streptomyces sp. APSN-46.1 TaxID=2929049 RepID=UPI001FB1A638|nr:DUF5133 domain-containing protein [Streptomyces sp. APSN-46.1]MCJ1676427.1 DUF5133 domain-containing protein [Streptomyces sp. APSN-46.1]